MIIDLPWPSKDLHPNARAWTADEDVTLRHERGVGKSLNQIAFLLGRTRSSLRARVTRLGLDSRVLWTAQEEAALAALFEKAGTDGALYLTAFAVSIGRDPKNVNRKARKLGLVANIARKRVSKRKGPPPNKFATQAERNQSVSAHAKQRIRDKGHPRGAFGMRHSESAKVLIGEASKASWLSMTDDQRVSRATKAIKTRRDSPGALSPKQQRGSWLSGWREIGGKRKYYRSRWEANYARYLEWLKSNGHIKEWKHEPETFWFESVKRGVRSYLPDFRVWENDGSTALHEVKGWMDDRSRVCLKRMAKYHPDQKLILIDGKSYASIKLKCKSLIEGWES